MNLPSKSAGQGCFRPGQGDSLDMLDTLLSVGRWHVCLVNLADRLIFIDVEVTAFCFGLRVYLIALRTADVVCSCHCRTIVNRSGGIEM
jgi:hypothetical protein